jgi:integrase
MPRRRASAWPPPTCGTTTISYGASRTVGRDSRADWQEWSDILDEAGIEHTGSHRTRNAAATIAIDQGVPLPVVQETLGHSDIRVTRGYVHVSSPLAQAAAAKIGTGLFGPAATKTATRRHAK